LWRSRICINLKIDADAGFAFVSAVQFIISIKDSEGDDTFQLQRVQTCPHLGCKNIRTVWSKLAFKDESWTSGSMEDFCTFETHSINDTERWQFPSFQQGYLVTI